MRYVVYGTGAVGGVIGGSLHLAGVPVTLVARDEHLARIRADGLLLDRADGRHRIDAPAASTAAGVGWTPDTVVLLCVKGHHTQAALADLGSHAPAGTTVVCAQNGVANERAALRLFAATYAMCVMLPATHLEPGLVVQKCHPTPGILDLGRVPTGVDERAEAIASDLRRGGFESVPRPDVMAWKRRKLLVNAVGDVSALCAPGAARDALATLVLAEGEAALAAAGATVVTAAADDARRGDVLQGRTDRDDLRGNSLWQSLARGVDSEIDYRAGEIVLLGRLHGVPTPANAAVQRAAHDLSRSRRPPQPLDAATLLTN